MLGISHSLVCMLVFHCGYYQGVALTAGQHYYEKQAVGRRVLPGDLFKTQQRRTALLDLWKASLPKCPRATICNLQTQAFSLKLTGFYSSHNKKPSSPVTPHFIPPPPKSESSPAGTDLWVCLTSPTWRDPSTPSPAVGWLLHDALWLMLGAKHPCCRCSALPSAPGRVRGSEVTQAIWQLEKTPAGCTHPLHCHSYVARKYLNLKSYISPLTLMTGGSISDGVLRHAWLADSLTDTRVSDCKWRMKMWK